MQTRNKFSHGGRPSKYLKATLVPPITVRIVRNGFRYRNDDEDRQIELVFFVLLFHL